MNQNPPPVWFPIAFAIGWCVILYGISVIGGWRHLAKRFRCSTPIIGTTWQLQSAGVRHYWYSNYGSCIKVIANEDGIGLSVLLPFRIGHPPMFIAWSEILVSQVKRFIFFKRVRLTFPKEPSIWIEISPKLAEKIQQAICHEWFPETGE